MSIVRAYGSTYKTSTMTKKPTTNALAKRQQQRLVQLQENRQ